MWPFLAFAVLTGLAGSSAKQIKNTLAPPKGKGKGYAKPVSDFQRRKAAQKRRK